MKKVPEELRDIVERRNKFLTIAFSELKDQIRIIGNPQAPAILFNDTIIISCYVKNFNLHFTNKPYDGEIVSTYKLKSGFVLSKQTIKNHLKESEHRKIFRISFQGSSLFLTGWNYRGRGEQEELYPVFSRHNPKVYFTLKKAEEVLERLRGFHYIVDIL